MKRFLSIIFVTTVLLSCMGVQASASIADKLERRDRREWNGSWYDALTFSEDVSWEEAKEYCESQGGHLLIVDSEEEQIMMESFYNRFISLDKYFFWIGAQRDTDGQWKWANGETVDFENWDDGEPADEQKYAAMYTYRATEGGFEKSQLWKWFASDNEGDADHTADKFGLIMEKDMYKEVTLGINYAYGKAGETTTLENIQQGAKLSDLKYGSDHFEENKADDVIVRFENSNKTKSVYYSGSPIKYIDGTRYNLEIPVPAGLESGSYKVTFYLNVAPEVNELPRRLIINNMLVGDVQTDCDYYEYRLPDAVCNKGTPLVVSNIQGRIPPEFRTSLGAAASNGLAVKGKISFSGLEGTYSYETDQSPLVRISTSNGTTTTVYYNLVIPYFSEIKDGSYRVVMDVYVPDTTNTAIKPYKFVIGSYIMNNRSIPHTHTWDEGEITIAATCSQPGVKTYKCTGEGCKETKTEEIPASGHSFGDWYVKVAPTSTEKGLKIRKCSACDEQEEEEIDALGYKNTKFTVADTTTLQAISGAEVFVSNADGTVKLKDMTDAEGVADFDLENGMYSVQIIATGYEMRNFVIEKKDGEAEFTPYLSKNSILEVSTNVNEMSREEIIEAGIDINAAANKHIYKCITVLQFRPVSDDDGVQLPLIELNFDYVCDDEGTVIKAEPVYIPNGGVIYPVSKDVYLIIHSQVTWLKEMFDVQLITANTSSVETIEDCVAKLELPEGLSLAVMQEDIQTLTVNMGDIAPNTSEDVHWYICGDKEGEYYLNGRVSGTRVGGGISEKLKASFTTEEPISVLAGNAMKLTIEAEKTAIVDKPYKVKYTLQNMSNKTLNDVALEVPGGRFCKAYSVKDVIHEALLGITLGLTGSFNNGYELKDEEFKPGEVLSGVFEITFGEGIDTEEYIKYMLTDMFTLTGHGSTTEIPTEIILVDNVIGHSWDEGTVLLDATCLADGILKYNCQDENCNETMTTVIPATGHSYGEWEQVIEATCAHKGKRARKCTKCGNRESGDLITNEHNWDKGTVSADKTSLVYTCKNCGKTERTDAPAAQQSGTYDNLSWEYFENGMLVISGEGAMPSAENVDEVPWNALKDTVKDIRIADGITTIGKNAFSGCEAAEEVVIPKTITAIEENAFDGCSTDLKIRYGAGRSRWEQIDSQPGNDALKERNIYYSAPSVAATAEKVTVYAPDKECMLIVIEFVGNKMVSKKAIPITGTVEKTIEDMGINTNRTNRIKVFLWENAHTISPLCENKSVQIAIP